MLVYSNMMLEEILINVFWTGLRCADSDSTPILGRSTHLIAPELIFRWLKGTPDACPGNILECRTSPLVRHG